MDYEIARVAHSFGPDFWLSLVPLALAGAMLVVLVVLGIVIMRSAPRKPTPHALRTRKGEKRVWFRIITLLWPWRAKRRPSPAATARRVAHDPLVATPSPEISEAPTGEIAQLRQKLAEQESLLEQLRAERDGAVNQAEQLKTQLSQITTEVERSYQENIDSMGALNTDFSGVSEKTTKENVEGGSVTEAEKILISQQAAEIRRLKEIIVEFKKQIHGIDPTPVTAPPAN